MYVHCTSTFQKSIKLWPITILFPIWSFESFQSYCLKVPRTFCFRTSFFFFDNNRSKVKKKDCVFFYKLFQIESGSFAVTYFLILYQIPVKGNEFINEIIKNHRFTTFCFFQILKEMVLFVFFAERPKMLFKVILTLIYSAENFILF